MWQNFKLPQNILNLIDNAYSSDKTIFPPKHQIFRAFELTDFNEVKVVILGQDPYINDGEANGLAFSVSDGIKIPPSLRNIFKEIYINQPDNIPKSGDLSYLATQGVLLLNTVLIVQKGISNSYKGQGFEQLTDQAIKLLNDRSKPVVFMLWGNDAIKKQILIDNPAHLVLTAPHPSPLSAYRGFFGCDHFNKANYFLQKNNITPIKWQKV